MAEIKLFNGSGAAAGTLPAPDKLANSNAQMALVHQVAIAELAGRRQGTASTKRRDEVAGSGVKIRAQKGTGRSRQGDKRVPHMRGGGVVHGPKPRDYSQATPRKMRQAAFRTGLNSRLQNNLLFVLEGLTLETPKTKELIRVIDAMELSGKKLLLLTSENDTNVRLSARNIPKVVVQSVSQTGLTDVLRSDAVVCTRDAWEEMLVRIEGKGTQEASA